MSTTIMGLGRATPVAAAEESRVVAALKTIGARFMAAQQERADRVVRPYLARLPEADLAALGFSAAEIARIRKDGHLPVVGWV